MKEILTLYSTASSVQESKDVFLNMGPGQVRFARNKAMLYRIIRNSKYTVNSTKNSFTVSLIEKLKKPPPYS